MSPEALPIPWYTVFAPTLTVTLSGAASPSATAKVKLLPDEAVAVISPSSADTLPFCGLVGCDENTAVVTLNVGVIDQVGSPPFGSQQVLGNVADCETCKSINSPMLLPVTVIGEGKFTVTLASGV